MMTILEIPEPPACQARLGGRVVEQKLIEKLKAKLPESSAKPGLISFLKESIEPGYHPGANDPRLTPSPDMPANDGYVHLLAADLAFAAVNSAGSKCDIGKAREAISTLMEVCADMGVPTDTLRSLIQFQS